MSVSKVVETSVWMLESPVGAAELGAAEEDREAKACDAESSKTRDGGENNMLKRMTARMNDKAKKDNRLTQKGKSSWTEGG